MKQRLFLTHLLLLLTLWVGAFNTSYYTAARGMKGAELKTALADIIYTTNSVGYDGLKNAYKTTDKTSDGYIWDMYSNITHYTPGSAFASSYSKEGDGYNREHMIPQSIFNSETPMYADLYHVYPTDAKINGVRGNNCHGEVGNSYEYSANKFSKWGAPSSSLKSNGCSETEVFEPNDEYKGDIARTYFYFVTCYQSELTSFVAYGMFNKTTYPSFTNWAKLMLLEWSENDPVSTKETNRVEVVYNTTQHNRNPFIDYPGLEQYIWGSYTNVAFDPDNYQNPYDNPTPATPSITLNQTSATLQEGSSLTLTATTQNAGSATVTWTSSNTGVATVSNGVVTALAAGSAIITAKITVSGTTYSATCNITVTSGGTTVEGDTYVKVTSTSDLTDGQYLIVYEEGSVAFNGGLSTLDAANNTIEVILNNGTIGVTDATTAAEFTINVSAGTIKSKSGYYIGNTSNSNGLSAQTSTLTNTITISNNEATIVSSGGAYLRYNSASD